MDTPPGGQLYQLVIEATGEVRDADGNLISSQPVTAERLVTEAEALAILEGNQKPCRRGAMHEIPPDTSLVHDPSPNCICDPTLEGDRWVHHALDGSELASH